MVVTLSTKHLKLQQLTNKDAIAMYEYRSDPAVYRFQNWEPAAVKEIELFIRKQSEIKLDTPGTWFQLGIYAQDKDALIGDCGLHFPDNQDKQVEIGITIAPGFQRNGFASEALRAVFEYLFSKLNKHRIFCSVDPRNQPSMKLLERVGMRKEAHFAKSIRFKGKWEDDVIFGMLEEEWNLINLKSSFENIK